MKEKQTPSEVITMNFFRNPISPFSAPDPFITFDKESGYYYALFTRGKHLEIFRSRHAATVITDADSKIIYTPNGEKDGFQHGYQYGEKDGYNKGKTDGYNNGYDLGYNIGYNILTIF